MKIAKSVQQAEYESPGSSFFENLQGEMGELFDTSMTVLQWVAVAAVAVAVIYTLHEWKRV